MEEMGRIAVGVNVAGNSEAMIRSSPIIIDGTLERF